MFPRNFLCNAIIFNNTTTNQASSIYLPQNSSSHTTIDPILQMFVPEVNHSVPTISIIGDHFCVPYLINLAVKKKIGFSTVHTDVFDDNGTLLLQIDGGLWQFNKKRTMFDSLGVPILTMRNKALSWQQQWKVHRGQSSDRSDLLYTVQKSQSFQMKTQLDVFLAGNLTRDICDFHVVGSYISQSFKVYKGVNLIAEVKERFKLGIIHKGSFEARIYPGVDYGFVLSLLVILNEIESE